MRNAFECLKALNGAGLEGILDQPWVHKLDDQKSFTKADEFSRIGLTFHYDIEAGRTVCRKMHSLGGVWSHGLVWVGYGTESNTIRFIEDPITGKVLEMKISRFLQKRIGFSEEEARSAGSAYKVAHPNCEYTLHTETDEIKCLHWYRRGHKYGSTDLQSCMSKSGSDYQTEIHPMRALFRSDDIGVAVLLTKGEDIESPSARPLARTVFNTRTKRFPRIYGMWEEMFELLEDQGFKHGSLDGAVLPVVTDSNSGGIIFPYVDAMKERNGSANPQRFNYVSDGQEIELDDEGGCSSSAYETGFMAGESQDEDDDRVRCEDCDEPAYEDDMTYVEEWGMICDCCLQENYVEVAGSHGYLYMREDGDFIETEDGERFTDGGVAHDHGYREPENAPGEWHPTEDLFYSEVLGTWLYDPEYDCDYVAVYNVYVGCEDYMEAGGVTVEDLKTTLRVELDDPEKLLFCEISEEGVPLFDVYQAAFNGTTLEGVEDLEDFCDDLQKGAGIGSRLHSVFLNAVSYEMAGIQIRRNGADPSRRNELIPEGSFEEGAHFLPILHFRDELHVFYVESGGTPRCVPRFPCLASFALPLASEPLLVEEVEATKRTLWEPVENQLVFHVIESPSTVGGFHLMGVSVSRLGLYEKRGLMTVPCHVPPELDATADTFVYGMWEPRAAETADELKTALLSEACQSFEDMHRIIENYVVTKLCAVIDPTDRVGGPVLGETQLFVERQLESITLNSSSSENIAYGGQ